MRQRSRIVVSYPRIPLSQPRRLPCAAVHARPDPDATVSPALSSHQPGKGSECDIISKGSSYLDNIMAVDGIEGQQLYIESTLGRESEVKTSTQ